LSAVIWPDRLPDASTVISGAWSAAPVDESLGLVEDADHDRGGEPGAPAADPHQSPRRRRGDEHARNDEEPREQRERRERVDRFELRDVGPHGGQHPGHVRIDRGPAAIEIGVRRVLGRDLGRREPEPGRELLACLGRSPVDLGHVPLEAGDLRVVHVRPELVDHLAALGRATEHLERERRGDQPDAQHETGHERPASSGGSVLVRRPDRVHSRVNQSYLPGSGNSCGPSSPVRGHTASFSSSAIASSMPPANTSMSGTVS
jgi:hypothetical protein